MIEFTTKHFAVLSTVVTAAAVVAVTVFLTAYLAVFDWSLVWLVEYSDIAKFGLIALAFLSGSIYFINMYADDLRRMTSTGLEGWNVKLFFAVWVLIFAGEILANQN